MKYRIKVNDLKLQNTHSIGVRFVDGIGVKKVCTNGKRVVGVETEHGYIHCDRFINCGGQVS